MNPLSLLAFTAAISVHTPDWLGEFLDGSRALERGDAKTAKIALEQANADLPEHAATAWQLACACARLGELDAAFDWLEKCIAWGGGEVALLEWDPDLASLRKDPRFAKLVDRQRAHTVDGTSTFAGELAIHDGGRLSISAGVRMAVTDGRFALIHDMKSNDIVGTINRPGEDTDAIQMSPNGKWVVASYRKESRPPEHTLRVFDTDTGALISTLDEVGIRPTLQFSADSRRLLVIGRSVLAQKSALWNTDDWTKPALLPGPAVQGALSPDGTRALITSSTGKGSADVCLWDLDTRQVISRHAQSVDPSSAAFHFSPDSKLVLECWRRVSQVRVLDTRDGSLACTIGAVDLDASSKMLEYVDAIFLGKRGEVATLDTGLVITIHDAHSGELLRTLQAPGKPGRCALSCKDEGRILIVTDDAHSTTAMESVSGTVLWTDDGARYDNDSDGNDSLVAYASWEQASKIRDARTGADIHAFTETGCHAVRVADPAHDRLWVGVSDGSVRCVDVTSGRTVQSRRHGNVPIKAIAISPDGGQLATIDSEGMLRLTNTETGELRASIAGAARFDEPWLPTLIAFSSNGQALAIPRSHSELAVFAAPDWERRFTVPTDLQWLFAWSPDSKSLAVADKGGQVVLIDVADGQPREPGLTVDGEISALAFEPDGKHLWLGTDQAKAHVFGVSDHAPVRVIDLTHLDPMAVLEVWTIGFRRDGQIAIVGSNGYGIVGAIDVSSGRQLWRYEYNGGNPSSLYSAFDTSSERVFVWGQGLWSPRIVSAHDGTTLIDLANRFTMLIPLRDEKRLAGVGPRDLEVVNLRDGHRLWSRVEMANEGWLLSTDAQFVDGTRDAIERIPCMIRDRCFPIDNVGSLPLDALAALLLDPKKVRAAADGVVIDSAHVPTIPTLTASEPYRRVVHVEKDKTERELTFIATSDDGVRGFEVILDGKRDVIEGVAIDGKQRSLSVRCTPPAGGSTEVRVRSISTRGILSRALRVTVERE